MFKETDDHFTGCFVTQLSLQIVVEKDIDGLEMGVLEDGTAYLSGRSLAKLCGVVPSAIIAQGANWKDGKREGKLAKMLVDAGFARNTLYIETKGASGTALYAYPDDVCTVFLDYYAFEADRRSDTARENFRKLARTSLRLIIYGATGYDPKNRIPEQWRQYHDRMLLNSSPKGHFSVFREISDIVLSAIRGGLKVDAKTVPDISVGQTWGKHWTDNSLDAAHGSRIEHLHVYPDYFPQSKAGPQPAWVYPLSALGPFRHWLQDEYLPKLFPNYLSTKVTKGVIPANVRELILTAVEVDAPALAEPKP